MNTTTVKRARPTWACDDNGIGKQTEWKPTLPFRQSNYREGPPHGEIHDHSTRYDISEERHSHSDAGRCPPARGSSLTSTTDTHTNNNNESWDAAPGLGPKAQSPITRPRRRFRAVSGVAGSSTILVRTRSTTAILGSNPTSSCRTSNTSSTTSIRCKNITSSSSSSSSATQGKSILPTCTRRRLPSNVLPVRRMAPDKDMWNWHRPCPQLRRRPRRRNVQERTSGGIQWTSSQAFTELGRA